MQFYSIIFPGQGSQSIGMLAETAAHFPVIKTTFAEASAVLDYDLWDLIQQGPAEKLNRTEYTQPALLTASFALWRVLRELGMPTMPVVLAGHSLGEYTALVAAEALAFADAVRLVEARGQYMQAAVPEGRGALAVIVGLNPASVANICQDVAGEEVVSPANFNSPEQIVVSGDADAVERVIETAKKAGAKMARQLPVSVPSHSALMKPAAAHLKTLLATIEFKTPRIPVINNADVAQYAGPESIRSGLVRQLYSSVRWVETIQACHKLGAVRFFECGPNKVLTGLGKRILPDAEWLPATDLMMLTERG